MRSFLFVPLLAAGLVAATKLPAIQRKISELGPAYGAPYGISKRQSNDECVDGTISGYQCCDDGWYCESSEYCASSSSLDYDVCCPIGATLSSDGNECDLAGGDGESIPIPDTLPGYTPGTDYTDFWPTATTMLPDFPATAPATATLSFYESSAVIAYTMWAADWDDALETQIISSQYVSITTTMAINTDSEADASDYFSSKTNYLSSVYSTYGIYVSASLAAQGIYPASIVTLGTASVTGFPSSAAASTPKTTPKASGSQSESNKASGAESATSTHSSASASGSAANTTVARGGASAPLSSGLEGMIASVLMIVAIGSGVSAVVL